MSCTKTAKRIRHEANSRRKGGPKFTFASINQEARDCEEKVIGSGPTHRLGFMEGYYEALESLNNLVPGHIDPNASRLGKCGEVQYRADGNKGWYCTCPIHEG